MTRQQLIRHDVSRKLWTDHVVWTRNVLISAIAGLPDLKPVLTRLLQNQADIAGMLVPDYGQQAAAQLQALLVQHIEIAVKLVGALKSNDTAEADKQKAEWYANADQISAFLAQLNPVLANMQSMMRKHLDLTAQEATARLAGNWDADVAAFDAVIYQALEMADMLSSSLPKPSMLTLRQIRRPLP